MWIDDFSYVHVILELGNLIYWCLLQVFLSNCDLYIICGENAQLFIVTAAAVR